MRRSPRLGRPPPPPPRTAPPAPVPAPPPAMVAVAVAAAGGGEEPEPEPEFDIRNDDGFVFKVPSGLYPDAAPSSTQAAAAGPNPEVAGLLRRRRALLRLRDKRLRQLSRCEALASELLAPLPAARPPASQSPPASPPPVASTAASDSASVLDDLIAQADVQAELLKNASQLCDEINALCDAQEADVVDEIAALPVWGNPRELVVSLQSPDEQTDPGTSGLDEGNVGFQILDSQQGKTANGVASTVVEKVKVIGDKRIHSPPRCKRCFQFGTLETCCAHDEPPPSVLRESRKRKGAVSPSSSNSVAAQGSNKTKSQKSGSKSKPSSTPGSTTRRNVASNSRALGTSCSPGPTTRRRAATQLLSPRT